MTWAEENKCLNHIKDINEMSMPLYTNHVYHKYMHGYNLVQ